MLFLFVSFLLGARAAKTGRADRVGLIVVGCTLVAGLFLFQRFA